jgi:hypothetical protein
MVRGQLSESFLELVRSRFDEVGRTNVGQNTLLMIDGADAAAERALITLLWDTGHDVIAVRSAR